MATPLHRLTILPYLQAWDEATGTLTVNVMLVPTGDPREALTSGWAGPIPPAGSFSGADLVLQACWTGDGSQRPTLADIPPTGPPLPVATPAAQAAAFDAIADMFEITRPPVAPERTAARTLGKYLPQSYRRAFSFVAPRTELAFTDDRYHCALSCRPSGAPVKKPSNDVSWGEALAYLSRLPAAMRAVGLLHTVTVSVGDACRDGGWLFFTLAPSSAFAPQHAAAPAFVKLFATRLPKLVPGTARPVFTSVQFPVGVNAASAALFGPLDEVFPESEAYSDGFARIVHATQARTSDALDEGDEGRTPLRDEGIALAWDDEDVLISQNRSFGLNPDGSLPPEAPRGVAGYRVDVRPAGGTTWTSLCRVEAPSVELGGDTVTVSLGSFAGERYVEVHPRTVNEQFYLPIHFVNWRGRSIVVLTGDDRILEGIPSKETAPRYQPVGGMDVPLVYGRTYDIRVRLADATGGGPNSTDEPVQPGEAPVATWRFRRFVAPEAVGVTLLPSAAADVPIGFTVARPRIWYPQAAFTGMPGARAALLAQAAAVAAGTSDAAPSLPDPDVGSLEISVRVRAPAFDPSADLDGYVTVSRTYRPYPADPDQTIRVDLLWTDCSRLSDVAWENPVTPNVAPTGPLRLPTARDVLIDVRAIGRDDLSYFGDDRARMGVLSGLSDMPLRVPARAEGPVFRPALAVDRLASVFLQPDPASSAPNATAVSQHRATPVLAKRFAAAANLVEDEGTLLSEPGRRIIYGASRGVNHHLAPDGSSLSFTALAELPNVWLNCVRLVIDRDWTWLGYESPAFTVTRVVRLLPDGLPTTTALGTVAMQHVVNRQAVRGDEIDRESSELVFIDAMRPRLMGDRPYVTEVSYEISAHLAGGHVEQLRLTNTLPVTTPPRQLPKVVSVGLALSEYAAAADYSGSAPRDRRLWIEFERPPEDDRDGYFVRVLSASPDPLMMPGYEPLPDPPEYEKPALDAELVRVIRPGQADDHAGLWAMQELERAAGSDRHYLLPLPPNLADDAPELFGFFTYEIRVGHRRGTATRPFWSTAQGRFGPGFSLEGVQHPAPLLACQTQRFDGEVVVSAPFAHAVHNGRRYLPKRPTTELWVALYAQVHRADGGAMRNLFLGVRRAQLERERPAVTGAAQVTFGGAILPPSISVKSSTPRLRVGFTRWSTGEIVQVLARHGLPPDMPLSALAIETLPEPNGTFADPLGGDLGDVRLLRTSPLTPIAADCCA